VNGDDVNEIIDTLNRELDKLLKWMSVNKLIIITHYYMIIRKKEVESNAAVRLNGVDLEKVKEIKYLGVIIDNMLKMKQHFERLCLELSVSFRPIEK